MHVGHLPDAKDHTMKPKNPTTHFPGKNECDLFPVHRRQRKSGDYLPHGRLHHRLPVSHQLLVQGMSDRFRTIKQTLIPQPIHRKTLPLVIQNHQHRSRIRELDQHIHHHALLKRVSALQLIRKQRQPFHSLIVISMAELTSSLHDHIFLRKLIPEGLKKLGSSCNKTL